MAYLMIFNKSDSTALKIGYLMNNELEKNMEVSK
jgi:hypothetical protein